MLIPVPMAEGGDVAPALPPAAVVKVDLDGIIMVTGRGREGLGFRCRRGTLLP